MMWVGMNIEGSWFMRHTAGQAAVLLAGLLSLPLQAMDLDDLPDPTQPHHAGAVSASGVQSILISPQRKVAVVHGRTVAIGDHVGDAVVVDIRPYEVILKRAGRESSLRLVPRLDKPKNEGG
jgi:MSHA biogenesis protein MshK